MNARGLVWGWEAGVGVGGWCQFNKLFENVRTE